MALFKPWLLLMFPLVYSPGPANILFASNGARFGFYQSIPFMIGINVSFMLQSLLMGFGLGNVLLAYPALYAALRWAGIAYILYLSGSFLRAAAKETKDLPQCLRLRDGLTLTFVNPKAWVMQAMMFSQFLQAGEPFMPQTLKLACWLALLNLTGHSVWILFGAFLISRAATYVTPRAQNALYAAMLLGSVGCMI